MDDEQLQRYSRHLLLSEVDEAGQEKLLSSKALIIGIGGLGSPAAMYLAASGVGRIVLADPDSVELSNLQRQIAHRTQDLGSNKADSVARTLRALNPDVHVVAIPTALKGERLEEEVQQVDIVLDCTDNFSSRQSINIACLRWQRPLVSASALRMAGQVISFRFDWSPSPCYHCLYPYRDEGMESCAQAGILAPVVGVMGSLQALEALKVLIGFGETLEGRLLQLDGRTMVWRSSILKPDPHCPVCSTVGNGPSALEYRTLCR